MPTIEYASWARGSVMGKKLIPGMGAPDDFQAFNLQVYRNGILGPRPFLQLLKDGWDNTKAVRSAGATRAAITWVKAASAYAPGSGDGYILAATPSGVHRCELDFVGIGSAWDQYTTTGGADMASADSLNYAVSDTVASTFWQTDRSSKVILSGYRFLDPQAAPPGVPGAISTVSATIGTTRGSVIYKARNYFWGNTTNPQRIFYSDVNAFDTVTSSSQFFDVAQNAKVLACFSVRDALLIATDTGQWYALTGPNPASGSLREIGRIRYPDHGTAAAVFGNEVVLFPRAAFQTINNRGGVTIVTPSGIEQGYALDHVRPPSEGYSWEFGRFLSFETVPALILPYVTNGTPWGLCSLDLVNGAWNYSSYYSDDAEDGATNTLLSARFADACVMGDSYAVVALDTVDQTFAVNATEELTLCSREILRESPTQGMEFLPGSAASAAHQSRAELFLRPHEPPPGKDVRVKEVIVEGVFWYSTTQTEFIGWQTPSIDLSLRIEGTEVENTAYTGASNDITLAATPAEGTPFRAVWRPAASDYGRQAQVVFKDIVSVAFRRVLVEYEYRDTHGAAR